MTDLEALVKALEALEAGNTNPPALKDGPALKVEPLEWTYLGCSEGVVTWRATAVLQRPLEYIAISLDIAKPSGCPKCGHAGDFVRMALTCPEHGAFGGC